MPDLYLPPLCTIHPWSPEALGPQLNAWNLGITGTFSSGTAANLVFNFPFRLYVPIVARQLWCYNGAAVGGNIDIAIYDPSGAKLISSGSTVQSGTSAIQRISVNPTQLGPGTFWLALVADSTSASFFTLSPSIQGQRFLGMLKQSAFPLPATASFLANANSYLPIYGLSTRSLI